MYEPVAELAAIRLRGLSESLFKPTQPNSFLLKKRLSNGIVEGFNNKAKLTMRKSYGFRLYKTTQVAL